MPAFLFQHATAGWLTLLGLVVPVAIYLWNRRPGRVVQVGSVRWLEAGANRRLRSLRPEGLLLLLVRMVLIGLLALAVAGPTWQAPSTPRHGQILLSFEAFGAALRSLRPRLDSLRHRGYELRALQPGLPLLSPENWAGRLQADTLPHPSSDSLTPSLWTQVRQAADSLPNRPLVVVAPLLLRSFRGTRPTLPPNVTWQPVPPASDSAAWLLGAYQPHPDSLLLQVARGSETGVRVQLMRWRRPAAGAALQVLPAPYRVHYQVSAGRTSLHITGGATTQNVLVQTVAPRYWVSYDAAHAADARVLRAALQAAGSVLPMRPRLTVSTQIPAPSDSLTWLFWLRDAPLSAAWQPRIRQGLQVWQEAATPGISATTTVAFSSSQPPVRILRHDTLTAIGGPVWKDAQGRPILSAQHQGRGLRYYLHTRLSATWSELADSPDLPVQLFALLRGDASPAISPADPRLLDPAQLPTAEAAAPAPATPSPGPVHDWTAWVVLAAGLLFGLERWLAGRRVVATSPAEVSAA